MHTKFGLSYEDAPRISLGVKTSQKPYKVLGHIQFLPQFTLKWPF